MEFFQTNIHRLLVQGGVFRRTPGQVNRLKPATVLLTNTRTACDSGFMLVNSSVGKLPCHFSCFSIAFKKWSVPTPPPLPATIP